MATLSQINPPRTDGYPKIVDISANKKAIQSDVKNPAFNEKIKTVVYN